MAKLQRIMRSNGSVVHSVNIPQEVIEESGWEKGDELQINIVDDNSVLITKG